MIEKEKLKVGYVQLEVAGVGVEVGVVKEDLIKTFGG